MSQPVLDIQAALRHLRQVDGPMKALIARHGAPTLRRTRNSFASLGRAIIYQQLSGKAAGTIHRRFLDLYPGRRFPRPEALLATPLDTLRGAGLSRAKADYLHDLARHFAEGTLQTRRFSRMDEATLKATLTRVRGVGPWSVDMFLIFDLLRPDVLPVGDLGVQKGMQAYFDLPSRPAASHMSELAAPWRPYRSVASWYMWRLADNGS